MGIFTFSLFLLSTLVIVSLSLFVIWPLEPISKIIYITFHPGFPRLTFNS